MESYSPELDSWLLLHRLVNIFKCEEKRITLSLTAFLISHNGFEAFFFMPVLSNVNSLNYLL